MSKLAVAVLVLAAILAITGNRWTNERPAAGFVMVDLTPVYLWSQWAGFLLALGAALYYVSRWRSSGELSKMSIVAAVLLLFFVAEGVPMTWDASSWKTRNVFAERRRESEARASREAALPRFVGSWKSAEAEYEFQADSLVVRRGSHSQTVSAGTCEFGYSLDYRMSSIYVFPANDQTNPYLEDLDFGVESPLLETGCGNARNTFLIRPDGKMVGFFMSERGETHAELLVRH
jgi:hypothetical protein